MKIYADKYAKNYPPESKFRSLAKILENSDYVNLLLKMAVNKGDSILNRSNTNESADQIG